MPFQSEKQRRFLHANHPEIAKRWEKEYAHGGILDINESAEIISDDGHDIELTDYNAAFDDPNDLSTGVRTLFMNKGGNVRLGPHKATDLLAKKNPDGTRAKYQPPGGGDKGMTSSGGGPSQGTGGSTGQGGPDSHGDVAHGDGGRFDVANKKSVKTSPKGDDAKEKYISTSPIAKPRYKESIKHHPSIDGPIVTNIRDYFETYQNRAPKTKQEKSLLAKIAWGIAIYTGLAPFLGLKVPGIVTTFGKVLGYRKEIDYALGKAYDLGLINKNVTTDSLADNFVENFKNRTAKKAEHDSLPIGHPDRIALGIELQIGKTTDDGDRGDDGPHLPDVVPIGEEIEEYTEMAPDAAATLASMRSKQALRAMINPDWQLTAEARELKNNPIVMTANSGGLANLFRVKNQ